MLTGMVAFDTARVERALRRPLGEEAAREVTEALGEGMSDHIATRDDVERLGSELRAEIAAVRSDLGAEMRQVEQRILIRLGAWTLAVMSVYFALLRLTL